MHSRTLLLRLFAVASLATVAMTQPASASSVTFASFFQTTNSKAFHWNGTTGTASLVSTPVSFSYGPGVTSNPALQGDLAAKMTLHATTTATASSSGGLVSQPVSGVMTISFTLDHPIAGLTNLLTITAQPGLLSGPAGSSVGSVASVNSSVVTYTSAFIHFSSDPSGNSMVLTLGAITPSLGLGSHFMKSFVADNTGSFARTSTAPEPSSLVLASLAGVALAGYGWRRRKSGNV
jgi:PEP-CTERM motif